ncbi:Do family serine endopeptidase [Noviherbaspirillum sp. CPCC 100848]|uniref:Probable periplasmic serine endoprotease DegP-like n=1 Tax=Noviherbaspirillum album TaxID=3080276 RepID=A0ABU6JHQ8_9BURK|nr:Do family serine endopeptidase [Noviherbaspirillum sp. CPCC 100848]MEC4723181.1 Do family serine endopeptidase [Noviherbaspirillum sp. CPCC 100848]
MLSKSLSAMLIGAGLLASSAGNAADWNPSEWFSKKTEQANDAGSGSRTSPKDPVAMIAAPNYRAIVEQFGPAVVGISTEARVDAAESRMQEGRQNDPFSKFFQAIPGTPGRIPDPGGSVRGQGSGFIVESDGLILTNAQLVRDSKVVTVRLSDRRELKAKVLGNDPTTDVAVLKIEATRLPVVNIGNPERLGVGDYVLAIGSPFGFEQSAASGIVSAKGRTLPGDSYVPFIQTDVALSPGNSGGPLFDAHGNVVGVNSQFYSRTGGFQGLALAIPIDVALKIKEQIVATGKVSHARLGVTVQEVTQALADSFGLEKLQGALVSSVAPESAAQKAGLQPGDVILKYNGTPINRSSDLTAQIGTARPGDKAQFEIWRNGKRQAISTTLLAATGAIDQKSTPESSKASPEGRLGLTVRPLTQDEQKERGVSGGLIVQRSEGPAARAGIQSGDIIVSVNGNPVSSVEQVKKFVDDDRKNISVLIKRAGQNIFVPVPLG